MNARIQWIFLVLVFSGLTIRLRFGLVFRFLVRLFSKIIRAATPRGARAAIRQNLVAAIQGVIKGRRMTHTEASFETRMGRTVITAVLNGNLNKISTDRLLRIAHRLGLKTELKVSSD